MTTPLLAGDGTIRRAVEPVPGQYIAVLQNVSKAAVPQVASEMVNFLGGTLRVVFNNAFTGFSFSATDLVAKAISLDPRVLHVEENAVARLSAVQTLPWNDTLYNLDRIDQRGNVFSGDNAYTYCERAGGAIAYVIDTGINRDHTEFLRPNGTSRVINGVKFASDHYVRPGEDNDYGTLPCGGFGVDNYNGGHGTAVASILGGNTYGVAKDITMVPIRVFPCIGFGNVEWVAWGVDWIRSTGNPNRGQRPAVVNMSFRVFTNEPLTGAMEHAINGLLLDEPSSGWTGIPVIVSANNQATDNSQTSPARMAYRNSPYFPTYGHVISVGGSDENDGRWQCPEWGGEPCIEEIRINNTQTPGGSNWGNTVDIYAPAHAITAAHILCDTCTRTDLANRSGTSFAAPLVTGIAARILRVEPWLTPTDVWSRIQSAATRLGVSIEPAPYYNDLIVFRQGYYTCSPEYP